MESNEQNKDNAAIQKFVEALKARKIINRWLKPKMKIEQFCGNLYDNCIFFSTYEHSKDMRLTYWGEIFNSIVKIDNNFEHIGLDMFAREMTALQVELFGLAWMHHFRLERYHGLEKKYTLSEIVLTKNYMERNGYGDIWDIMSYYNNVISDAILHPCIMAIDRAFSPLISIKDEIPCYVTERKYAKMYGSDIDNWKKEVGLDCTTRVLNRISTHEDWGGCPIALMLTMKFSERLGWKVDLRDEGFAGFEKLLDRLYNDLKQEIETVEIK